MKITFPSFPIVLPKQPVYMHFRAVLMKNVNYWPHTVFLFISLFMLMYGSSFLFFFFLHESVSARIIKQFIIIHHYSLSSMSILALSIDAFKYKKLNKST